MLKNKHLRRITYIMTGVIVFAASAVTTLALMPTERMNTNVSTKNGGKSSTNDDVPYIDDLSPKDNFILKMQNDITRGLSATLNEADFTIKSKESDGLNIISLSGTSLDLVVKSLDDISLDLHLPLDYNGKKKELNLTWVDDVIYFDVNTPNSALWDVKYKIDLTPYDVKDEDGEILGRCEQGDFDFIYEDIIQTIGHDISIDLVGDSSFGDLLPSMEDALDKMETVKKSDGGYDFFLELPIKDTILPVRLSSDDNYTLTNIKMPCYKNGQNATFTIDDNLQISLDAAIEINNIKILAPTNAESYSPLVNSLGIFNNIYPYVNSPKFGLDMKATLTHDQEATYDSDGTIGKEAMHETAGLDMKAYLDISDKNKPVASLDLGLSALDENEKLFTQKIGLSYFGENSEETMDGKAFINLGDVAKMRTTKLTMDSMIGRIKQSLSSDKSDKDTLDQITKIFSFLSDSSLIKAIKKGTYEPIVDMIESIKTSDNKIDITISLAPLNIEGSIKLSIDGSDNPSTGSLATLDFLDIKLSSFTFNGTLKLVNYIEQAMPSLEEYSLMSHLPGVVDQICEVADSRQAAMTVRGSIMSQNELNKNKTHNIGFEFAGDLAFDLNKKGGTGNIVFTDYKEDYDQTHRVTIDVQGPENEIEDENDANSMLFSYNSGSSSGKSIKGRASISALNDIIDLMKGLIGSNDKRFARYRESLSSMMAGSLLNSLISGKYTSLITSKIIESVSITKTQNIFVISKDIFGTSEPMTIKIDFENGRFYSLNLSMNMNSLFSSNSSSKAIDLTICLTKTSLSDDELLSLSDQNLSNYTNFSSIGKLLDMIVGSALLGSSETNSLSTYHLSGSITLKTNLAINLEDAIKYEFYIAVDGRAIDIYGTITMPVIVGLNGSYATLLSSKRTTKFYYQTSNDNLDGTIWITRDADYLGWSHDNVEKNAPKKIHGTDFRKNMLSWIGGYMMGFNNNSSIKSALQGTSSSDEKKPIYFEDCLNKFEFEESSYTWKIGLDIGELAHNDILKDAYVELTANKAMRTMSHLYATLGLELINVIKITASINADVMNIKNNVYSDCWTNSAAKSEYTSYITSHANDAWASPNDAFSS